MTPYSDTTTIISMALTILTNEQAFEANTANQTRGHLGTRDRTDPSCRFDFPGKASGCLAAAKKLQQLTGLHTSRFLTDGYGQPLPEIVIKSSWRLPEREELAKGHELHYLESLESTSEKALNRAMANEDPFISDFGSEADVTPGTFQAARSAVGASFDMIDTILSSPEDTGFALVWPPGHHAERARAMGFCYLSNAGLAALYARDHITQIRPGHRNRVVIIDIDHHRGNGTTDVLANAPDLLFVDVSYRSPYDPIRRRFTDGDYNPINDRYEDSGKEYPYSKEDTDYHLSAHPVAYASNVVSVEFEGIQEDHNQIIGRFLDEALTAIHRFQPDIVLWSVGLDSARGDPLGGLGYRPSTFYTLIRGTRLAFPHARHGGLLEGGYDVRRWFTCLPPALLGFHEQPDDRKNRCHTFRRYRDAFTHRRQMRA